MVDLLHADNHWKLLDGSVAFNLVFDRGTFCHIFSACSGTSHCWTSPAAFLDRR